MSNLRQNAAAHREPDLSAIRWSRLFDLILDILEVPVPDVELVTRPPALHIRSSIEPCRDPLQSGSRIARAAAKLHDHVKLIFLPASAAVASVCFDGFLDEGVKELIKSVLPVSGDDELPSPLGELPSMLLLTESLLHLWNVAASFRLRGFWVFSISTRWGFLCAPEKPGRLPVIYGSF